MRLYRRLRNSRKYSRKEIYLAILVPLLNLRASLVLIYSNFYKSKVKPFS